MTCQNSETRLYQSSDRSLVKIPTDDSVGIPSQGVAVFPTLLVRIPTDNSVGIPTRDMSEFRQTILREF